MLRTALIAVLMIAPTAANADPAEDYEACLVGRTVIEALTNSLPMADAFNASAESCSDLAAQVPASYGDTEGEGGTGAAAVEEGAIHIIDALIAPLLRRDESSLSPGFSLEPLPVY